MPGHPCLPFCPQKWLANELFIAHGPSATNLCYEFPYQNRFTHTKGSLDLDIWHWEVPVHQTDESDNCLGQLDAITSLKRATSIYVWDVHLHDSCRHTCGGTRPYFSCAVMFTASKCGMYMTGVLSVVCTWQVSSWAVFVYACYGHEYIHS